MSWSVVDSDDEQDLDDDKDEDLYTWCPSTDAHGNSTAELPPPLVVASLDDGFTGISKVLTVQNINGAAAVAMANQGSWLIKGKKMKKATATTGPAPKTAPQEQGCLHCHDDYDNHDHDDDSRNDEYASDDDLDGGLEHELSKSARAVNRRNIRVANARGRKLEEVVDTGARSRMDYKEIREARWLSRAQKSTDADYAASGTTRK
ncbi:hypothetical protein DFQ27_007932 [Actinomortierella ambigua]|uniref:Uncharacterized protein n=1 Tax=Actinomortierella ambigua TaxID=1343610 RepID=A0A9P6PUZ6_9FUNG|nr:hypothetical protein DFQ27_007932 [Actinomortierella ambigua]